MEHSLTLWAGFFAFIIVMLSLDLGVFNRRPHAVTFREAAGWSVVWVFMALMFYVGLNHYMDEQSATEFITGYLIEKSLSVDNIFVFVLTFQYFKVPRHFQHRVLFWGIIGALLLRGILIGLGAALLQEFHWVFYLFGAFLLFTGIKLLMVDEEGVDPNKNFFVRNFRKFYPVREIYDEEAKFFIVQDGKRYATLLLVVILMVGTTDVIFALDSIPAIFAITLDPFIVFTANVFAVLGLRSMYFLLESLVHKFHYLKIGLSVILSFVGIKMLVADVYKISTHTSLMVIGLVLLLAMIASLLRDRYLGRKSQK